MNYAYMVCSDGYCSKAMCTIKSLNKHCDYTLLCNVYKPSSGFLDELNKQCSSKFVVFDIPEHEWKHKRMFCKVDRLLKMDFTHGDNVFVLDTDLYVQDDIYKLFDKDFDVFYTTHSHGGVYPINGGVWGFKFNEHSKQFLNFYVEQMQNPVWEPYVKFREAQKGRGRTEFGDLDWWCDQDFLCAVYINEGNLPFECSIIDAGEEYNFFWPKSQGIKTINGNKKYKVLHCKSWRWRFLKTLGG